MFATLQVSATLCNQDKNQGICKSLSSLHSPVLRHWQQMDRLILFYLKLKDEEKSYF